MTQIKSSIPLPISTGAVAWALTVFAGASLAAQQVRARDPSAAIAGAFDARSNRLTIVGVYGETASFDGSSWRASPVPRFHLQEADVVYDSVREELILVGREDHGTFVTLRHDGVAWRRVVGAGPVVRSGYQIAFDEARGEVVLFGGADIPSSDPADETWVFDGQGWTQRMPTVRPMGRSGGVMTYDSTRQRVVLFGGTGVGLLDDTWEWDGSQWRAVSPATKPAARYGASLAYDPARGRCVLFGGDTGSGPVSDVWEYDGVQWRSLGAVAGPAARFGGTLAYSPALGEVFLVGGWDPFHELFDAWSWNGVRWLAQPAPAVVAQPPRRFGVVALVDGNSDIVTFGGWSLAMIAETWRRRGGSWARLPVVGPSPRMSATACGTLAGGLLFGGETDLFSRTLSAEAWSWNGAVWAQVASGPPARSLGAMAQDLARQEVVLFGGFDGSSAMADTWTFDGTSWQLQQPATQPAGRFLHGIADDLPRSRVVMCGGLDRNLQPLNDTFEWDGVDWTRVVTATNPPGGSTRLAFDLERLQVGGVVVHPGLLVDELWHFDGTDWSSTALVDPLSIDGGAQVFGYPRADGLTVVDGRGVFNLSRSLATVETYGSACSAGAPAVTANRWPETGAADFAVEVVRAPSNGLVALVAGLSRGNIPIANCNLLVAGGVTQLRMASANGFAAAPLPIPAALALRGLALHFQAAALAPAAPAGFTLSAGYTAVIGS